MIQHSPTDKLSQYISSVFKGTCRSEKFLFCAQLQNEITRLRNEKNRCHILEHILRYGEISPMSNIIHDFKSMSDFYMHQLVKEIEIYRSSADERSQLIDFLNYLRSVTREIEDILIVES